MSEQELEQRDPMLLRVASRIGSETFDRAIVAGGAVVGALVANQQFPAKVELAPDVEVEASLSQQPGLTSNLGVLVGEAHLPNVPVALPDSPFKGVRIDPSRVDDSITSPDTLSKWLGLLTNYESAIAEPIKAGITNRLKEGFVGGALIATAGYLAVSRMRYIYKDWQRLKQAHEPNMDAKRDNISAQQRKWIRKPLAAIAIVGGLAGCGAVYGGVSELKNSKSAPISALPYEAQKMSPLLKGGTIKGPFRDAPRTIIDALTEMKKDVDTVLIQRSNNFAEDYRTFTRDNETYRQLRANPNITSVLFRTDLHCNRAFAEKMYGRIVEEIRPDLIVDGGDMLITGGSTPIEEKCYAMFAEKDGLIPTVAIRGNHDREGGLLSETELKLKLNFIDLSKKKHAKAAGIHFVTVDDPEKTKFTATDDEAKALLDEEIANQGEELADEACKVRDANKGVRPIAVTHRWQLSAATLLKNCSMLGLSGHVHSEGGIHKYRAIDGASVLQSTSASMIGARSSFTYYNDIVQDASFMEIHYEKSTDPITGVESQQIVAFTRHTLEKSSKRTVSKLIFPPVVEREPDVLHEVRELAGIR